jgi:integrase
MLQITAQLPLKAKSCAPPPKKPSTREREYLRTDEIRAMIRAAKKVGRHGIRDGGIILLMFRHGLRTAELVALKMDADRFSRWLHRSPKSKTRSRQHSSFAFSRTESFTPNPERLYRY